MFERSNGDIHEMKTVNKHGGKLFKRIDGRRKGEQEMNQQQEIKRGWERTWRRVSKKNMGKD